MTSKIGMAKSEYLEFCSHHDSQSSSTNVLESSDPVFDDLNRKFTAIEQSTDKLLKDAKVFSESVIGERNLDMVYR
jgi:hypothetical protein